MNIYVDGCSYTAGYNLDKKYSLASLVGNYLNAEVVDKSRVGKSNYSIALDLYTNTEKFDLYIIGWTYSSRIEFDLDSYIVDGSSSRINIDLGNNPNGEYLENEYSILQSKFFRYASRMPVLSNYFIDTSALLLADQKYCFFSWEQRNTKQNLFYPIISKEYRQQDTENWQHTGHLTKHGMEKLANMVLEIYDKQK